MIGMIGISQQCLIPTEVLTTPTRSQGQILQAKADGILTTTAITRAHGLESLTTILILGARPKPTLRAVVNLIRLGTWWMQPQSGLGRIPIKIPRTIPLKGLRRRLHVRLQLFRRRGILRLTAS